MAAIVQYITKPDSPGQIRRILNPLVERWFFSRFSSFSLPQLMAVRHIHSRQNVLVSAPTGATKTLTGFLPVLNELVDSAQKGILEHRTYCVYISPLKALSYDIEVNLVEPLEEMEQLNGSPLGIRVAVRTGDTSAAGRAAMLRSPPHILITTPESLAILLSAPRFKRLLTRVQWLIVDEVHAIADNKRGVHLSLTMERLACLSPGISRVGLSATVAPIDDVAQFLVGYENGSPRDCMVADVQFMKQLDLKVLSPLPDLINSSHEERQEAMHALIHSLVQEHRTTLIFTNTRAATERVVSSLKERYPKHYNENIGAHHGSLSAELRRCLEGRLRRGELRAVVCSTSLELGIDIGYIDLVILLGSPKSVARTLQRTGRSGHRLHETTKGRIIVLNRDDLVECAVLLKSALEHRIDRLRIPQNALDVLAQHVFGMAIDGIIHIGELHSVVRRSYCYRSLERSDLLEVVRYLAGHFAGLEDRSVYAKIWYDEETGMMGRRGKLARVLYSTNIGTIPDEAFVTVKVGSQPIGRIDEAFLERLRRGDVFVLGGEKYEFLYARGMVAQVNSSVYRPPTIPSWASEMLPLSFDLALEIGRFRRLMDERMNKPKKEALSFVRRHLHVEEYAAESIYMYFKEQYLYSRIATDRRLVVEHYPDQGRSMYVFHALFGRRVNDALSRALAYAVSRLHYRDIDMIINDNGFCLASPQKVRIEEAIEVLKSSDFRQVLELAVERTEILRRRFRHCATRSLMILRNYKGRRKQVGRQQVSSGMLMNAARRISPDFPILKESRREVLEDLMDINGALQVIESLRQGRLSIEHVHANIPSPFAFNIVLESYSDILRMEDKVAFLRRMHEMVLAKISLSKDPSVQEFLSAAVPGEGA